MSNDTAELSASIKTTYAAFLEVSKRSIEHALALGDLLSAAKEKVKHGDWLRWLERECPSISERHARNFMALARHRPLIESKSAIIADMTLSQALALIPRAVPVKLTKERPVVRSARDPGEPLLHRFTPEAEPDDDKEEEEMAKPKSCRFRAWRVSSKGKRLHRMRADALARSVPRERRRTSRILLWHAKKSPTKLALMIPNTWPFSARA